MEYSILIMGGMYSGKSEELKKQIKRYEIAGKKCQVFKPAIDDRYSIDQILTHDSAEMLKHISDSEIRKKIETSIGTLAYSINNCNDMLELLEKDVEVVGIDEVQFMTKGDVFKVINTLNEMNIRVIISGLDMYSTGEPFKITSKLACTCKYVKKIHAICVNCGERAYISHKLIDNNEKIDIGSSGKYIALCQECHSKM